MVHRSGGGRIEDLGRRGNVYLVVGVVVTAAAAANPGVFGDDGP